MKTKIIIVSIVAVLFVSVAFKLKSNKRTVEENIYRPDPAKKVLVQAEAAVHQSLDKHFAYTGTFAAGREVLLVPQVHGEVESVHFEEGDRVKAGALLVQINDDLLQAQYAAAEANYQHAKRNLARYERASQSGGVSNLQLDNLRLNVTSAEAEVKQLAKHIQLSRITAPFAGTITLRDAETGSMAGGNPVARVTDLSELNLEISVPEKEIALFREGEITDITTDVYPGKTLKGKIDYVANRGDDAHNYAVRIVIANADPSATLKAGMYGTVVVSKSLNAGTLIIPRTALLGSAKNPQVFVVIDGKANLRTIRTGHANNTAVEVVEGLQPGDVVVTSGHINLAGGSPVEIVK